MPLYEYRCASCSSDFETLVRSTEQVTCPTCESKQVDRILSVTSARVADAVPQGCPPVEAGPCGPRCCRLPN